MTTDRNEVIAIKRAIIRYLKTHPKSPGSKIHSALNIHKSRCNRILGFMRAAGTIGRDIESIHAKELTWSFGKEDPVVSRAFDKAHQPTVSAWSFAIPKQHELHAYFFGLMQGAMA